MVTLIFKYNVILWDFYLCFSQGKGIIHNCSGFNLMLFGVILLASSQYDILILLSLTSKKYYKQLHMTVNKSLFFWFEFSVKTQIDQMV